MQILFSISSYLYLQKEILTLGNFEKGDVEVKIFPDGERYQRILSDVEGKNVVLLGGTPTDTDTHHKKPLLLQNRGVFCTPKIHPKKTLPNTNPIFPQQVQHFLC